MKTFSCARLRLCLLSTFGHSFGFLRCEVDRRLRQLAPHASVFTKFRADDNVAHSKKCCFQSPTRADNFLIRRSPKMVLIEDTKYGKWIKMCFVFFCCSFFHSFFYAAARGERNSQKPFEIPGLFGMMRIE